MSVTRHLAPHILSDIRQRLGCEPLDDACDPKIERLSDMALFGAYIAWHLGDPSWAGQFAFALDDIRRAVEKRKGT